MITDVCTKNGEKVCIQIQTLVWVLVWLRLGLEGTLCINFAEDINCIR